MSIKVSRESGRGRRFFFQNSLGVTPSVIQVFQKALVRWAKDCGSDSGWVTIARVAGAICCDRTSSRPAWAVAAKISLRLSFKAGWVSVSAAVR